MYTHPDNAAKLAGDRHRDLRADIGRTAWPASSATWPGRTGAPG